MARAIARRGTPQCLHSPSPLWHKFWPDSAKSGPHRPYFGEVAPEQRTQVRDLFQHPPPLKAADILPLPARATPISPSARGNAEPRKRTHEPGDEARRGVEGEPGGLPEPARSPCGAGLEPPFAAPAPLVSRPAAPGPGRRAGRLRHRLRAPKLRPARRERRGGTSSSPPAPRWPPAGSRCTCCPGTC